MTEDLRALLRADLRAERPPPLGDLVAAAIRDGRRIRRRRRIRTFCAAGAVLAALVSGGVLVGDGRVTSRQTPAAAAAPPVREHLIEPPQSVPIVPGAAPTGPPRERTLTIHSGTARADGLQKKATSAAMLHLLTLLLPPGRTSHYGVSSDDDLQVQLYLDDGNGPALVRVELDKRAPSGDESPRGATVTVTIRFMPDDCEQSTEVAAAWPDGTAVRVDVANCLPVDGFQRRMTRPALTLDQAIRVASDPRWGLTMDDRLVTVGARQFPKLPVFS